MFRLNALTCILKTGSVSDVGRNLRQSALAVCGLFSQKFAAGADPEVALGFVPARIEVAGKHTDYAGGHTLVCAIDKGFLFVAGANQQGKIRMVEDSPEFEPLEFPFTERVEPPAGCWANYPMTMAQRVARNFGTEAPLSGVDIAFASDIPVGSGMSGSSALMMMCFCAIAMTNDLGARETFQDNFHNGIDLAMYLACAENGQSFRSLQGGKGVGTFGGSEDHTAILNCRSGAVSLFQYAPTMLKAETAWPSEWTLVLAFSGVRAEKTKEAMEKYNLASRRAALAVDAFNHLYGKKLRNLGEVEAETRKDGAGSWLEKLGDATHGDKELDLPGRIRQFLREERETTPQAIHGLLWRDLALFGGAVSASHEASQRLLWNIVHEVDFLQKSALSLGAAGASGFGAGFGGSVFAVIGADEATRFTAAWRQEYESRYPERRREAAFFVTSPGSGIRIWDERGPSRFVDTIFQG